jgi:imidazolonepropionase-like amidohydrolase
MDILRSMTVHAAELPGLADERGRIEPSYRADIIALSMSPLDDITNIATVEFVMKDGSIVRLQP